MPQVSDNFTVLLVSGDDALRHHWRSALVEQVALHEAASLRQAEALLLTPSAALVLLDRRLVTGNICQALVRLTLNAPTARVLLIANEDADADRVAAIKAGVIGYCAPQAAPTVIRSAVAAIRQGEVWLPRAMIAQLIASFTTECGAQDAATEALRKDLCRLTAREFEVARLVHQSANNKVIARTLNISERTVKAHLSAIFKKLNVGNRVRLALLFNDFS